MAFTQDFRTQRRNYADGQTRIGEKDRLWYDSESNSIRIGDGETPGGIAVGGAGGGDYTLPTATTTVKGGVKIDGQTIVIDNQQISVGFINYSSISNPPTFLSDFTNDVGFITSSALSGYATQTYVTTRGYITSYTETDPVFVASDAYNINSTQISNWDTAYGWGNHASAGYLTTVGTISYNDLSDKPTIPSNVSQLVNDSGYITAAAIPARFTFNVAADDSTLRTISTEETVKFIGAGGITTSSDAEGAITITQGVAAAGTLTGTTLASGVTASSLTSVGTLDELTIDSSSETPLSITATGRPGSEYNTWSFFSNQGIGGPSSWIQFPDSTLQTTAWTGSVAYSSVTGTPTLATVATSGSYADLTNKPTLFSGSYTDLTNKPTLFDGAYSSLSGKPTLFSGSYTDLTDKPTIPTNTNELTNGAGYITSSALSGYATETYVTTRGYITSYTETDPVFVASAAYNITSTQITNWDTAYGWGNHASAGYLTTVGTISYNDLTDTPTIPADISDLTDTTNLLGGSGIEAGDYVVRAAKNGSTVQTIPNGTDTVVTLVDDFDPQGWWTSNKFQPTIAGYYSMSAQIWWGAGSINNNQTNLQLRKNGNFQLAITQTPINNSTVGEFLNLSTIAYFNGSTDYVEVTAYTANPTSQDINPSTAGTWFSAALYGYGSASGSSFSGDYNDLTNKPTLVTSYTQLTDKPIIPQAYTFNVAADDSTQRTVGTQETIKFIGAGGITTASDAEGNITITQGAGGAGVFSNQYSLTTTTSNATETELLVNGSTRIPVATNTSVNYIVNIAARRTDTPGDYAMFEIRGVAANSAGTVSDIGSVYEVVVARTNAGYLVDVRADDTNNSVNVYVTGVSGHTVDWKAIVQTIEV